VVTAEEKKRITQKYQSWTPSAEQREENREKARQGAILRQQWKDRQDPGPKAPVPKEVAAFQARREEWAREDAARVAAGPTAADIALAEAMKPSQPPPRDWKKGISEGKNPSMEYITRRGITLNRRKGTKGKDSWTPATANDSHRWNQFQDDRLLGTPREDYSDMHRYARGGIVYANRGIFVPRGTDTVPAMLTPGEFVVNRAAVNRGNNLQFLKAMNNSKAQSQPTSTPAMAAGGQVGYYQGGGMVDSIGTVFSRAEVTLGNIFASFNQAVDRLESFRLAVRLDPTSIKVTFDEPFLASLREDIRRELFIETINEIQAKLVHDSGGRHRFSEGIG
jgi:hypothetical protein